MINPRDLILWLTFGIPTIIQGWFLGAMALMVRRARDPYLIGPFLVTTKNKGKQQYTTTLGAWVNKSTHASAMTMYHELEVHGEQYLELNVLGGILALVLIPALGWWSFLVWGTSGFMWLGPNFLVALVRYKSKDVGWMDACYYWTSHEQDAYARTEAEFDGQRARWEKT
jgi:hypothetical protein